MSVSGNKLVDGKGISGRECLTNDRIDAFHSFYIKALRANKGKPLEIAIQLAV